MTEAQAYAILRSHAESQFPKECPNCQRTYPNLREYLLTTRPVGMPISYDAEAGDWGTTEPIGGIVLANCPCGTTVGLSTNGLSLVTHLRLLRWLYLETRRSNESYQQVLLRMRAEITRQVLAGE